MVNRKNELATVLTITKTRQYLRSALKRRIDIKRDEVHGKQSVFDVSFADDIDIEFFSLSDLYTFEFSEIYSFNSYFH